MNLFKNTTSESLKLIESLLAKADPRLQRRFLEVIKLARNELDLDELADLLSLGRFNEALASVELRFGAYANEVNDIFILAGRDTAKLLNDVLGIVIDFDQVNERAVNTMRTSRLNLIREFSEGQVAATREALVDGIERGLNPLNQAKAFRDSIGLTQKQQQSVNNFRRLLSDGNRESLTRSLRDKRFDATVRRSIESGKSLTPDQIDRMVSRYQDRFVRYRSEVIARTESLRSVHQGTQEMYQQAIDEGKLDPTKLTQEWLTAQDESVRGHHASMNGQTRPVGKPFLSGLGNFLMHPGDPSAPAVEVVLCRCILLTEMTGV